MTKPNGQLGDPDDDGTPVADAGELLRPDEGHIAEADAELERSREDVREASRYADTAIDQGGDTGDVPVADADIPADTRHDPGPAEGSAGGPPG